MRYTFAKVLMRIVGTLGGLLGVGILCFTALTLTPVFTQAVFPLAVAAYLLYVAYLVWFRFSPLAVRHICGALGFCVLTLVVAKLFDPARHSDTLWAAFAFLGSLLGVYFAYRAASHYFSRLLFPEGGSGVQPSMVNLFRVFSIVGFLGYGKWVFFVIVHTDNPTHTQIPGYQLFLLLAPLAYMGFCFLSTFLPGRAFLVAGLVAHLMIMPTVIFVLRSGHAGLIRIAVIAVIAYSGMWVGTYLRRRKKHEAA